MYYVCIENNKVVGIQNYEPSVPPTITVIEISDSSYQQLMSQTHVFDVATRAVVPVATSVLDEKEQYRLNGIEREFLNTTDWKILRHIREKALGQATSLTEEEYLVLEQQRSAAAARII